MQSKRTKRWPRTNGRFRGCPIVGMVPLSERGQDAAQRRVPGHWEGDLIIGKNGTSCAATLVERMSGFTGLLALPSKHAEPTADAVIEYFNALPEMMRSSLAWDQGSEMAQHAKVSLATAMPVYFADPHSPLAAAQQGDSPASGRYPLQPALPRVPAQGHRDPRPPALPHHHRRGDQQPPPPSAGLPHPHRSIHPTTGRPTPCCFDALTPPSTFAPHDVPSATRHLPLPHIGGLERLCTTY